VAGNEVFVGTDDGTVEALSQAGGTVVWQASVPGSVTSSPSVDPAAGLVVVTDASGHITALSMATGRQLWQVATGGPITASATLWNHRVYVGSGDGTVEALAEQTGALQWSMDIGSPVTATGAIYATQQVGVDYAVGAQDGTVGLLDLATGTLDVLDTLSQPVVGLAASQGWIAVTGAGGGLWGLKRLGEALYDTTLPTGFASAPTVLDGVVYTAGLDHTVRAFTIPGRPIP
jgi:outer membrane protein assembly factor BamB